MARTVQNPGEIRIKLGGEAGFGIKASGQTLARTFTRAGLHTFDLTEYPSLIRGGHNVYFLRASSEPIYSHVSSVDVLIALNQGTLDLHLGELCDGCAVIFDPSVVDASSVPDEIERLEVPLEDMAREAGLPIMRNTVANGAVVALLDFPFEHLEDAIRAQFAGKAPHVADSNVKAARAGYDHAKSSGVTLEGAPSPNPSAPARIAIDGNSATGLGALAAGIGLYAAYPMSPASSILHFMAANEREHSVVVKHTEDELAAMNMIVGAAFTGARAMCATSGGGFALMTEAFGLAGVSESAVVVVVSQRPGPATGLPTWTEQGDLRTVLHAGQGEFPRVIMAPGDQAECFLVAWHAFNLADQLQTPVAILLDNYLSENRRSCEPFDVEAVRIDRGEIVLEGEVSDYRRYALNESGVSPRAVAGVKGALQVVNSYEHDEYGFASETAAMRNAQDEKRMRKLEMAADLALPPSLEGPADADVAIVCWGSTKGPVREAAKWLAQEGLSVSVMHVLTLWPFPNEDVSAFLTSARSSLVVEGNITGQLEGLIREQCLVAPAHSLRRYDGRPHSPEDIAAKVREVLGHA